MIHGFMEYRHLDPSCLLDPIMISDRRRFANEVRSGFPVALCHVVCRYWPDRQKALVHGKTECQERWRIPIISGKRMLTISFFKT